VCGRQIGYPLRLFCTSSKFYPLKAITTVDSPTEFPQTCEIYINDMQLKTALLKGIKKRPGTTSPPELAPVGVRNTVRMIYINGGQGQPELEYKVWARIGSRIVLNFVLPDAKK
jgi:hypothetical protein